MILPVGFPDSASVAEYFRPFVQKGAAWLDENHPDWVEKVSLSTLNVRSGTYCICGQVFGSWGLRPCRETHEFGFDLSQDFCRLEVPPSTRVRAWAALNALWEDEIGWRLLMKGRTI